MLEGRFESIDTSKSPVDIANEVLKYWKAEGVIARSLHSSLGKKDFTFLEGPPTANGRPHVGHAMTRTFKDTVLRYRYITGYKLNRRTGGWDCHGLPVEIEAEKHFAFKTKKEIEDFGIDKFNDYCRRSVFSYIDEWKEADARLGFWIDHDEDYITLKNEYIESEWWALKSLYEKDLLTKDFKIVPYCPRCETSLSTHELSQGYDDARDPSLYVKFKETGKGNRYFLAWTTTPWTLPSNQFLSVNPDTDYVLLRSDAEEYYLAENLAKQLFGENFEKLATFKGKDLEGIRYEQLLDYIEPPEGSLQVVSGYHVSLDEGTGIVHTSPAFGADDFEVGKRMGVSLINPINLSGKFEDPRLPFNGLFFKDADVPILKLLKERNAIFKSEKIVHTYPFCYRCGTPLLYYPLKAWFIKVSSIREKLISNNEKINWMPEHLREGRFGNFLAEAKDWALSRNRFWGTPLPIWTCPNNHMKAVGSFEELKALSGVVPEDVHRPFIDAVTFNCPECKLVMTREPYVIDTWFDSGSATYAALGYPSKKKLSPERDIPITFITEAIDQTRGWFYTLHVIGSLLFDRNAYGNVLSIDHILDENGRKMSKSKGNSVYALDFISEFGPDPIRLFFLSGIPWRSKAIDRKLISELHRKVLLTLTNVYSFFESNANLDGYRNKGEVNPLHFLDRWIVSKTTSALKQYREKMDSYELHSALRIIQDLVDSLSNFYVRLSRRRFWDQSSSDEKLQAYNSLYYCLSVTLKMLSPMAPFYSDYIYGKLNGSSSSVHLELLPEPLEELINMEIERKAEYAYSVIEHIRRLRQEKNIKGRQPVKEVLISGAEVLDEESIASISDELNARSVRLIKSDKRPVIFSARLVLNKAAPILKERTSMVREMVEKMDSRTLKASLGSPQISLGKEILPADFIEILEKPEDNYAMAIDHKLGFSVFLSTEKDGELEKDGLARETLRRIQVMRKEMGLQYDDRISVTLECQEQMWEKIMERIEWICGESLSNEIVRGEVPDGKEWEISGETIRVKVTPEKRISIE